MSLNETSAPRQHASTGPSAPATTRAKSCRTYPHSSLTDSVGTLSTMSRKHPGFPFGSLMPFALDLAGRPVFLISNMAMHTQNLKADPRCSLFVGQAGTDGDPLGAARATLIGQAEPVPEQDPLLFENSTSLAMKTAATGSTSPTSAFSGSSPSTSTMWVALA